MKANKKYKPGETGKESLSPDTGNASNPSPRSTSESDGTSQLLSKEAEKYLREVASIEDLPDATDQDEMEESFKKKSKD